jgi:hypothetical protein
VKVESNLTKHFSETVLAASDLPAWVGKNVASVRGLDEKILDQSYLDFLDEQIALSPRGPEWTKVLQKRRAALAGHCGKNSISGIISEGEKNCFVKIDSESKKILYWELWG